MTQTNEFIKDPEAVLDYKFDFKPLTHGVYLAVSDYLSTSETIVSATVTGETGIVVDSYAITEAGTSVTAWKKLQGDVPYPYVDPFQSG
jgi:hypothetical protein